MVWACGSIVGGVGITFILSSAMRLVMAQMSISGRIGGVGNSLLKWSFLLAQNKDVVVADCVSWNAGLLQWDVIFY